MRSYKGDPDSLLMHTDTSGMKARLCAGDDLKTRCKWQGSLNHTTNWAALPYNTVGVAIKTESSWKNSHSKMTQQPSLSSVCFPCFVLVCIFFSVLLKVDLTGWFFFSSSHMESAQRLLQSTLLQWELRVTFVKYLYLGLLLCEGIFNYLNKKAKIFN